MREQKSLPNVCCSKARGFTQENFENAPKNGPEVQLARSFCLAHSRGARGRLVTGLREGRNRGRNRSGFAGRTVVLGRPEVANDHFARRGLEMEWRRMAASWTETCGRRPCSGLRVHQEDSRL